MKDNRCIFCKLANGEMPAYTIYEDDIYRVILDANPATKGHALILPKEHFEDIYSLDDEFGMMMIPLARRMATIMTDALGCDGFNLVQNNGEEAGQTVNHFHLHLIPRYKNGPKMLEWSHLSLAPEEMEELCSKLKR